MWLLTARGSALPSAHLRDEEGAGPSALEECGGSNETLVGKAVESGGASGLRGRVRGSAPAAWSLSPLESSWLTREKQSRRWL